MARDAIAFLAAMGSAGPACSASPSAASSRSRSRWYARTWSAGWSWPPRRRRARLACAGGRPRSSARSAPHTSRKPTWTCSLPARLELASRHRSAAAHVCPDRRPGRGHDVGDRRGAVVTRSAPGGFTRSRAAAAGERHRRAGVRGQRRHRSDDPAPLLLLARGPDPARPGEDLPRLGAGSCSSITPSSPPTSRHSSSAPAKAPAGLSQRVPAAAPARHGRRTGLLSHGGL
jgi:hypothetical protein